MDHKKKKMYMGGGKMKPMYLKGGQVKLDANKDGKITGLDFKMLKEMKGKKMAKGGKMKAVYNEGGMVGDPKKKEAMKLIAQNEGDYDNNLLDFYSEGNMEKADSVRQVMMDRYKRIVELGFKAEADDSLPYDSLKSMKAYEKLAKKQSREDKKYEKKQNMKPIYKKGGQIGDPKKKKLSAFEQAFADARKAGKKTFSFNGKEYNTAQKGENIVFRKKGVTYVQDKSGKQKQYRFGSSRGNI